MASRGKMLVEGKGHDVLRDNDSIMFGDKATIHIAYIGNKRCLLGSLIGPKWYPEMTSQKGLRVYISLPIFQLSSLPGSFLVVHCRLCIKCE